MNIFVYKRRIISTYTTVELHTIEYWHANYFAITTKLTLCACKTQDKVKNSRTVLNIPGQLEDMA